MADVNLAFIGTLNALTIPTIAAFAAWIAHQQLKIARAKVVIDLFKQRYEVLGEVTRYVHKLVNRRSDMNDRAAFWAAANRAQFLFPADVTRFIEQQIAERSKQLIVMRERDRSDTLLSGEVDYDQRDRLDDMEIWFVESAALIENKFKPYLTIPEF